jgi:hypothetical protein
VFPTEKKEDGRDDEVQRHAKKSTLGGTRPNFGTLAGTRKSAIQSLVSNPKSHLSLQQQPSPLLKQRHDDQKERVGYEEVGQK